MNMPTFPNDYLGDTARRIVQGNYAKPTCETETYAGLLSIEVKQLAKLSVCYRRRIGAMLIAARQLGYLAGQSEERRTAGDSLNS